MHTETRAAAALTELQDFIELRAQHHTAALRRKWAVGKNWLLWEFEHAKSRSHDDAMDALLSLPFDGGGTLRVYAGLPPVLGGAGGAASASTGAWYDVRKNLMPMPSGPSGSDLPEATRLMRSLVRDPEALMQFRSTRVVWPL